MERVGLKKYLRNILPEKKHFTGVDIGEKHIKVAEVMVINGTPEVVALRTAPSPPEVWGDNLDEEALIKVLREILNPNYREVITCISSEKVVCRIVQLPQMTEKELWSALRIEIQKYVPVPVSQLAIRYVKLGKTGESTGIKLGEGSGFAAVEQDLQDLLILAVPLTIIYQYHGIFSRSGYTVTAIDLQAFALWRVFAGNTQGGTAMLDIGTKTSHFVLIEDRVIRFIRLLPAGSEDPAGISRELQRSLDYYSAYEKISVDRLLLSGQINNPEKLNKYLRRNLGINTTIGSPHIDFTGDDIYDPAYAIPIGLALREVKGPGSV